MTRRIHVPGGRQPASSAPDATGFVFMCLICPWQVQAGYKARRDFGPEGLLWAMGEAHMNHVKEDHEGVVSDIEIDFGDGNPHNAAADLDGKSYQGALMAVALPRWWVER